MQNFDYRTPTRLIFGKGSVEKLPDALRPLGKTILLTYGGGSIKKIGLYDKVKALLADFKVVELSGIQPNPKYNPSVLDGIRLCRENGVARFSPSAAEASSTAARPSRLARSMTARHGTSSRGKSRRATRFPSRTS